MRKNIFTNTPSEKRVGYSRAVRVGDTIYFSGTTSQNEIGETIGKNVYEQTTNIFNIVKEVLEREKFSLNDVVSLTVYLIDMKQLPLFDRAFKEYFAAINPTCTLVGVSNLVKSDLLIEIKCTAKKIV